MAPSEPSCDKQIKSMRGEGSTNSGDSFIENRYQSSENELEISLHLKMTVSFLPKPLHGRNVRIRIVKFSSSTLLMG